MNWFKNLKTRTKLVGSFLLVIFLMIALGIVAISQLMSVGAEYRNAIDAPLAARRQILVFQREFRDLRRCVMSMAAFTGTDDARCEQNYKDGTANYQNAKDALQAAEDAFMANTKTTAEQKKTRVDMINKISDQLEIYNSKVLVPAIDLVHSEDRDKIIELITTIGDPAASSVKENATNLLDVANTTANNIVEGAKTHVNTVMYIIIAIIAASVVFALIVAVYLTEYFKKPLASLAVFFKNAGEKGDITITPRDEKIIGEYGRYKDEFGEAISGAASFVNHVASISEEIQIMATGDFSITPQVLSDQDKIGTALRKLITDLRQIFGEITVASDQVNSGGTQVSGAAQALSQGATEQASAVQELSASINEVSNQIRINSNNASQADELVNETENEVTRGNSHMANMLKAMNEINDSSHEISKIIKVIDDIAFQTNILALNAAVEAARAGAAGKGFAVVAEEVRNLASKSADAAKQTTALIEGSITSVEKGSETAQETAKSLEAVAGKTKQVQKLVNEIANASRDQADAVRQITQGVEQISQVVQTNSATAEQSAAASQELSGQAHLLQDQVSKIKIR